MTLLPRFTFPALRKSILISDSNRSNPSIAVPSGGVQSLLEEADADVLLLYDCCHSASAPTCHLSLARGGVTESIAACGFGDVAAEVDEHSFTKALTKALALTSKQPPFTGGDLHARISSQLKCWSAPLARDQNGNPTDRLEPQRRKTPIYSILSETKHTLRPSPSTIKATLK